jgi:hypothetical protein
MRFAAVLGRVVPVRVREQYSKIRTSAVKRKLMKVHMNQGLAAAVLVQCLALAACSKNAPSSAATGGAPSVAVVPSAAALASPTKPKPGDPDCYKTASAEVCPPDPSDPSGRRLPAPGSTCTLGECAVCGSTTASVFRDATGASKSGWCICVAKSDGSGSVYSCFAPSEWQGG